MNMKTYHSSLIYNYMQLQNTKTTSELLELKFKFNKMTSVCYFFQDLECVQWMRCLPSVPEPWVQSAVENKTGHDDTHL